MDVLKEVTIGEEEKNMTNEKSNPKKTQFFRVRGISGWPLKMYAILLMFPGKVQFSRTL